MAQGYWLINSNKSEVRRFIKNDKFIDGVFEYMFIDSGKIVGTLGKNEKIPLLVSIWTPIITLSIISLVGIVRINEK